MQSSHHTGHNMVMGKALCKCNTDYYSTRDHDQYQNVSKYKFFKKLIPVGNWLQEHLNFRK